MSVENDIGIIKDRVLAIINALAGGGAVISPSDIKQVGGANVPVVGATPIVPTGIYDSAGNQIDEFGIKSAIPFPIPATDATPTAIVDKAGNQIDNFGSPSTNAEKFAIANYTSDSTVTVEAAYIIDESVKIVALVILRADDTSTVLTQGSGGYTFEIAGQIITSYKDGAVENVFAVGDKVLVSYTDFPYGYDSSRDASKVDVINQDSNRNTPYASPLITETTKGYGATVTTTVANGVVTGVVITAGGQNYAVGNILRLEGGDSNCWVRVSTIGASPFAITAVTLLQAGTGYTTATAYNAFLYTPVVSDASGTDTLATKHLSFGGHIADFDATMKFIVLGSNNTDGVEWTEASGVYKKWHTLPFYDICGDTFSHEVVAASVYKFVNVEIENINRVKYQFGVLTNSAGFEYAIYARAKVL